MRKILPLLLLVLGLVTLGVAVAQGVGGFVGSLQSVGQPWVAPQASTQDLTAGAYVVYEQSATRTLGAQDVTVTGPAGAVTVNSTISSTLTLGDVTYVGPSTAISGSGTALSAKLHNPARPGSPWGFWQRS